MAGVDTTQRRNVPNKGDTLDLPGAPADLKIYGGHAAGHFVSPTARFLASPSPLATMNFVIFPFAFFAGGIIPLFCAIIEIIRNNLFAAVTFTTYGTFYLGYTLFGMLQQAGDFELLPPIVQPTQGLQFALLMFAIVTVIYIGLSIRINIATTCVFTSIALAFFLLAGGLTNSVNAYKAGGYFSVLGVCLSTWYLATAELVHDLTGKAYLPLGWYPWAGFAKGKHEAIAHSRRHMDPHLGHNGAPVNCDLEAARPAANNSVV
eukprot:jgi/Astpho2/6069/Aster-04017